MITIAMKNDENFLQFHSTNIEKKVRTKLFNSSKALIHLLHNRVEYKLLKRISRNELKKNKNAETVKL